MTFGEKRAAFRTLHRMVAHVSTTINDACDRGGLHAIDGLTFTLPAEDWTRCEWALGHVKTWIADVDADGNRLTTGHFARLNLRFCNSRLGDVGTHFLIKGCPVFLEGKLCQV
jgi:hypothetical protein